MLCARQQLFCRESQSQIRNRRNDFCRPLRYELNALILNCHHCSRSMHVLRKEHGEEHSNIRVCQDSGIHMSEVKYLKGAF